MGLQREEGQLKLFERGWEQMYDDTLLMQR